MQQIFQHHGHAGQSPAQQMMRKKQGIDRHGIDKAAQQYDKNPEYHIPLPLAQDKDHSSPGNFSCFFISIP